MIRAGVVTLVFFCLLELLGAREHVSVISGTVAGGRAAMFLGLLDALTFFTVVLVVPPLLVAGAIDARLERRRASAP
jgi:hypothetical protein